MLCIFSHISAFCFRQQHPFLGQSHFYAFHFVVFRWILKINVLRNLLYRITCPSVWYVSGRIFFSARHRAKTKFNFYANDRSSWILFKKRLNAVEYAIANKVAFCFVFFCVCVNMEWIGSSDAEEETNLLPGQSLIVINKHKHEHTWIISIDIDDCNIWT